MVAQFAVIRLGNKNIVRDVLRTAPSLYFLLHHLVSLFCAAIDCMARVVWLMFTAHGQNVVAFGKIGTLVAV